MPSKENTFRLPDLSLVVAIACCISNVDEENNASAPLLESEASSNAPLRSPATPVYGLPAMAIALSTSSWYWRSLLPR